ncbi:MAG: NTP transferase domain-containing protein [Parcubacteria group bacterium]|nr:NTP transferase domain-containing protein [Parcubacteria group bacterium]
MQAVILAGGKGTRLKPYTAVLPKPLVPVGDWPVMEIVIRQLKAHGFKDVIVATGHLAALIETYFGNGSKYGMNISYIREDKPLSTAGAIGIIDRLDDNFLVMNGDILTDINYLKLFNSHLNSKSIATAAITKRLITDDYGVVEINNDSYLQDYKEKPVHSYYVSMGINVMSIKCKEYIESGKAISIPELFLKMKNQGEKIYCYKSKDHWFDIGSIDDFQLAQDKFEKNKNKFLYEQM